LIFSHYQIQHLVSMDREDTTAVMQQLIEL